jgi:DNA-binding MarR family transcriptional regulator
MLQIQQTGRFDDMAGKKGRPTAAEEISGGCLAVRMRTLNRAVTALYDEALRPHGLRVGQLNLLVAVARMGTAKPGDLCGLLRMDKSTLSRDAEVMRRNGWLEVDDPGGRARPLRLSSRGQALLEAVVPAWRRAQERARRLIGDAGAEAILVMARELRSDDTPGL